MVKLFCHLSVMLAALLSGIATIVRMSYSTQCVDVHRIITFCTLSYLFSKFCRSLCRLVYYVQQIHSVQVKGLGWVIWYWVSINFS